MTAEGIIGELSVRLLPWVLGVMGSIVMLLLGMLAYEARQMRENWEDDAKAIRDELRSIAASLHSMDIAWTQKLGLMDTRVGKIETQIRMLHPDCHLE